MAAFITSKERKKAVGSFFATVPMRKVTAPACDFIR
jgi:hypothetical protein